MRFMMLRRVNLDGERADSGKDLIDTYRVSRALLWKVALFGCCALVKSSTPHARSSHAILRVNNTSLNNDASSPFSSR
jgi:hypothetical protein